MVTKTETFHYIIDASSILSQKDSEPYRRKIHQTLWNNIDQLIKEKRSVTCSEIIEEVQDDELKKWYKNLEGEILPINDAIQEKVKYVVTSNPQLVDLKARKSSGDPFLIATALQYNLTIITEESPKSSKKIPAVCNNLDIPCINLLGLCEKENWKF